MHFDGNRRFFRKASVGWVLALGAFACSEAAGTLPAVASGGAGSGTQTVASATTSGGGGAATGPGSGGAALPDVDATGGTGPTGQGGGGVAAGGGFLAGPTRVA